MSAVDRLARGAPAGVAPQVARALGLAAGAEKALQGALVFVAERHRADPEISRTATVVAGWSARHLEWLRGLQARYGSRPVDAADRLRAALFSGSRRDATGLLDDLRDLYVLGAHAEMTWTTLVQGAKELLDEELQEVAADAREHTRRTMRWLRTAISHNAPEALAVVADPDAELSAAVLDPTSPGPPSPGAASLGRWRSRGEP